MTQILGIDISQFQGSSSLAHLVASTASNFAIIRAGYGGGGVDSSFKSFQTQARSSKITHGYYFFAYPGRSNGVTQANEFKKIVGELLPGEFIALDLESEPSYGRNLIASDVKWTLDFLTTCEKLFGVKPLLYINTNTLNSFDWSSVVNGNFGLWQANYGLNDGKIGKQPPSGKWPFTAIWQFTSKPIDRDIFFGTLDQLQKYGKVGTSSPSKPSPSTPKPSPSVKPVYIVAKAGDSVDKWSSEYGLDKSHNYQGFRKLNPSVTDPNKIFVGSKYRIK